MNNPPLGAKNAAHLLCQLCQNQAGGQNQAKLLLNCFLKLAETYLQKAAPWDQLSHQLCLCCAMHSLYMLPPRMCLCLMQVHT
jgi:hypothetical protein